MLSRSCFTSFCVKKLGGELILFGVEWGFINTNGELVIPLKYGNVSDFQNGICEVFFSPIDGPGINQIINLSLKHILN